MALKSDGTVVTWGSNHAGALEVPPGLSDVIAIAAGQGHSLALRKDGTVVAWGDNDFGQSTVPSGLNGVVAVAGAVDHSVALKSDGTVVSWGAGQTSRPSDLSATFSVSAGQQFSIVLSDATTDSVPAITTSPMSQIVAETQSATFSVAATGPLPYTYQWRKNGVNLNGATAATYSLTNVTLTDAGDYDVVVTNYLGSTTSAVARLTVNMSPVVTPLTPASQIVRPGQTLSLGVNATGTGSLSYQWLGNGLPISGATGSTFSRNNITRQDSGWYAVVVSDSAGSRRSAPFFVTVAPELTQVVAWSSNIHGATTVPTGLNHVLAVTAGNSHAVALKTDGTVVRWGYSQYGLDTMPTSLTGVVAITAGPFGVLALKSDATVTAWGDTGAAISRVPIALQDVVAVTQGYGFSVALRSDGTVVEWGGSSTGVPSNLDGVIGVAAGNDHLLTLQNDGTVLAWGRNDKDQASVPAGLSGIKAIAAGSNHSLALKADGTVVAWGDNTM